MYINEHGNFPVIMQSFLVLSIAGFIAKDTVLVIMQSFLVLSIAGFIAKDTVKQIIKCLRRN